METRRNYRMTGRQALTVLCSLAWAINTYLTDAWQSGSPSRINHCVRMAADNLSAYTAICDRYGSSTEQNARIDSWRNDIAQLTVVSRRIESER